MGLLERADAAARAYVLERDNRTCQHCGRDGNEWAHILGRGNRYIRHLPDNGVCLCRGDHAYFTDHPHQWRRWVAEKFGPDRWDDLTRLEAEGERSGHGVDLEAVVRGFAEMTLTSSERIRYATGDW